MSPFSVSRLLVVLLFVAGFWVVSPAASPPSWAAPAKSTYAVLIVSDSRAKAQRVKEEQIVELIHKSLDDQGLPREVLPILTYHTNQPGERAYCEKALGIKTSDLVFLGLAQHKDFVVKKVMLRVPNVVDPVKSVGTLFERAVAVLSKIDRPTSSPAASTSPDIPDMPPLPSSTPPPAPSTGARIRVAVMCHGVNSSGQPLDHSSDFSASDTFHVSCEVKGLRYGTVLEARWYSGKSLLNKGRLVSNKEGDYYAWFSMAPTGRWKTGTYRVDLYVDGEQQASQFFRVTGGD